MKMRQAQKLLRERQIDTAQLDARLLAAKAFGCAPADVLWHEGDRMSSQATKRLSGYLARRIGGEPMAYILGQRSFWKNEFTVTRDTLIPRPDSETLISAVLERITDRTAPYRFLDLGTGSGCLLLSLLREYPAATGIGVDISAAAVSVAIKNEQRLNLQDRAGFLVSNWFSKVDGTFDIVVANPPYIVDKHIDDLEPDIRDFEPRRALAGGGDGLTSYRDIAVSLPDCLKRDALVAIEVGAGQSGDVCEIFGAKGFRIDGVFQDLGRRDRCILMRR